VRGSGGGRSAGHPCGAGMSDSAGPVGAAGMAPIPGSSEGVYRPRPCQFISRTTQHHGSRHHATGRRAVLETLLLQSCCCSSEQSSPWNHGPGAALGGNARRRAISIPVQGAHHMLCDGCAHRPCYHGRRRTAQPVDLALHAANMTIEAATICIPRSRCTQVPHTEPSYVHHGAWRC
jgi:hypothetical protein